MSDDKLIQKYNEIYDAGEENFWTFLPVDERRSVMSSLQHWTGFDILEIGCGTGDMAAQLAAAGAQSVTAIDVSMKAIESAKAKYSIKNLEFFKRSHVEILEHDRKSYDVVVMIGVLEHMQEPFTSLRFIMQHLVKAGGIALVTCPNFINPRGYIWKTLEIMFDVKMSLTDKHEIHITDVQNFVADYDYALSVLSLDVDWAMGPRAVLDFKRRLSAACPDIDSSKIKKLLDWLTKTLQFETPGQYSGANLLYQIARPAQTPTIQ